MAAHHICGGYTVAASKLQRADAAAHDIRSAIAELRKTRDALTRAGLATAASDLDAAINALDEVESGLDTAARAAFARARRGQVER